MLRIPSIILAMFVWLLATNHCLLAGVIDLHGCSSGECSSDHGLDHNHGCDSNCHSLEKASELKTVRGKLVPPAKTLADTLPLLTLFSVSIVRISEEAQTTPPFDGRLLGWSRTWRFQTRAARLPGAPDAS